LRPLLLFPGGGGHGVEVEDCLILAVSPVLQRATASHGNCSSTAIVLPFITSTTLHNFVALLRQGRVAISKEEMANLEVIFSILEIKIEISIGAVCETSISTKGDSELLKTKVDGGRSNKKGNQPGCTTLSETHTLKTHSLLHTMPSSPAKRPAVTSPKEDYFTPEEEPSDLSKRRRTCSGQPDDVTTWTTSQLPSAPTKPPPSHDHVTVSSSPSIQIPMIFPEAPTSQIFEAENQQVSSPKTPKERAAKVAIQGEVAPELAVSESGSGHFSSAVRQPGQASAGQQQRSCASRPQSVQGQLFQTPQGKVLQQKNRRILKQFDVSQIVFSPITCSPHPSKVSGEVHSLASNRMHSLPIAKGSTPFSTGKRSTDAQRKKPRLVVWETKIVPKCWPKVEVTPPSIPPSHTMAGSNPPKNGKKLRAVTNKALLKLAAAGEKKDECDKEVLMSSKMVRHKANAHFEPCGLDRLVDEFEEEEEDSQTLFNSRSDAAEEPLLEMRPSLDEDSDTTPSLVDASASMKRQIQTELKDSVAIPPTQSIPPQLAVSGPSKSSFASIPPQFNTATPNNLPKEAPTGPEFATLSRVSKPIVIMDSDGDWTVGGQQTPLFKSKSGKERKLKKPKQIKLPSTTPIQQSSRLKVPKCDMATSVSGSDETQPSSVVTSPLPGYFQDASSVLTAPSATPINGSSLPLVQHGVQLPVNIPEAPKSPILVEDQRVSSPKNSKEKTIKMAIQGEVATKLAGSGAGQVSSAVRQPGQASVGQQQRSSAGSPQSVQGQLFETPQGKVLQQGNRRILLGPDVTVKDGKVEVSLEQMAALTGTRPTPKQGPAHFNTPRGIKVSPKDVKEPEANKVKKNKLPLLATEVLHSSPRSLKKFALGLRPRESRSLGRGAFAKEDWSFYPRQKKQETPQDCPECGRTFSTGSGLSCHMRNKH